MDYHFTKDTAVTQDVLKVIAHLPTRSLPGIVEPAFWLKLSDADFMRIGVLLAQKSYDEGGCPIGGVVIDNETRAIMGKGHNTLVQDNDPYNHGETAAIRDCGRIDFSKTTIFSTLSPCDICATLIYMRGFPVFNIKLWFFGTVLIIQRNSLLIFHDIHLHAFIAHEIFIAAGASVVFGDVSRP